MSFTEQQQRIKSFSFQFKQFNLISTDFNLLTNNLSD